MLSTENPHPDLSEISQLKSVSSDERTCGDNQHQFEVDLCKSGLDDSSNSLPKFSIRDYVFSTRGKDIKNNWPFSQQNLQLCLKHGVKDVLPPFQSLDSVRNQSIVECAADDLRDSDVKNSELSDHRVGEIDTEKINSAESEEDKEFPSTTTSQSCSDINSVPTKRSSCLEPEAVRLLAIPTEKPEFAVRWPNKNVQSPVKKCRLIVKLNNITEPKSNEDLPANIAVVSETMASKVCPVCKTFSSSSNTTLNAHIDQCLSGESSTKWTANSKVIKHRIKPRKTRLMVDIYETALHCTLEDLDKRNGTNWASNLGPPSQDLEVSGEEEEKQTYSPVFNDEDINQEGAVYIDSRGTKLRILSKLSHLPNAKDDGFIKRDKGRDLLSSKKKKYFVQKHKLQNHSFDGQGSCSPISDHLPECSPHGSNSFHRRLEVDNGHQKLFHFEGNKEDDPTQPLETTSDQMKSDDFGMIKKWVGSRRSRLKKKINLDEHANHHQHPDRSMKNLRLKSVDSLGDALAKGNTASISPVSSYENPHLPTKSHKRKEYFLCNSRDGCVGSSCQRKRPALPLLNPQNVGDKKNHLMISKFNVKESRKDNPSVQEHLMGHPSGTENHVSSWCNKKMGISSSTNQKDDPSFIGSKVSHHHRIPTEGKKFASLRKTSLVHAISSGSKKFSSLRTKLLSVRHASVTEPKKHLGRKLLKFKNARLHYTLESESEEEEEDEEEEEEEVEEEEEEEEVVVSRSAVHRQDNMVETRGRNQTQLEKDSTDLLINRPRVLKIRKKVGGIGISGEGAMESPESDSHSAGKNVDCFTGADTPVDTSNDLEEEAEMRDEFVSEPTYGITNGEAFSFNKSLDSAFPRLTNSSTIECGSHFYNGPSGLVLNADQDHDVAADEGQGNYFVDVDPIPIPGPPGSFLPSPGRMGSEELQGHSSLTTCRIQSSEEGHEVVDMDSSDSPISAISAVSNTVAAARSNSISITNLSEQSHFQHETQCNNSEDRSGPVVEGSSAFEQVGSGDRALNLLESRPNIILPEVTREAQNIQPYCCSRKDGVFQGGSLNYQESQILRRRTMTSLVLAPEKQMGNDPKNKIHSLNFGSENEPSPEAKKKHAVNSPFGYPSLLVSRNSETVFPACGVDCESTSPSTPNPVLRLMGKNLMVVNKDENPSPPPQRLCAENGHSTDQNEPNSFLHNLPQGPSTFNNLQPGVPQAQLFDFKIPDSCGPPPLSAHPSTAVFPSMSFGGSVASRCHGYANGFNLIADQLGSKIRLDPPQTTTYDAGKVSTSIRHIKTADYSSGKHKEIIIIDDSPESEAVNPFCSYQTRFYHPRFGGSPVVPNGNNTLVPPPKGKWNCVPEGSSVFHSSSSSASRSSVYFSPGFS